MTWLAHSTSNWRRVPVSGFGDAKLRVAVSGLAASRPQTEITAHVATSLEALFAAQRQDEGQRREMSHTVDLDQRLRLRIRSLGQFFDRSVVLLDLHRHVGDLLEQRAKRRARPGGSTAMQRFAKVRVDEAGSR